MPTVTITRDPSQAAYVVVCPESHLETATYVAFRTACHAAGCIYEADEVSQRTLHRAPRHALPHLIETLDAANFDVNLAAELHATLTEEATRVDNVARRARARLHVIESELAARGEKLWGFQRDGVVALAERAPGGFLLADQPALGKTPQAILATEPQAPTVVVTQASIVGEWQRAYERWEPRRRRFTYTRRQDFNAWPMPGQVAICTYDSFTHLDAPPPGLVVILDEAHFFKNPQAKRVKRWNKLRDCVLSHGGTIYLLTGTPLVNDLGELWTVLQLANLGKQAFTSRRRFVDLAAEDPTLFAQRLHSVMLRRLKREVLADLPPKVYRRVDASISDADRRELDAALKRIVELAVERAEALALAEAAQAQPGDAAYAMGQAAQAALEARENVQSAIDLAFDGTLPVPFELIARVKSILALAKARRSLEVLGELESEDDAPILFFSAHLEPANLVAARPGWGKLTGDVPTKARDQIVRSFQAGQLRGLALTIRAGGAGLNLQRSHVVLRNDREWTPAQNEQAEDRAHRPGATEPVQVIDVVADHVLDQRIAELLQEKQDLIDATVEQAVTRINEERRSRADQLAAIVANSASTAEAPAPRREARPDESALVRWAQASEHAAVKSIARQLKLARGRLSTKQWEFLARLKLLDDQKREVAAEARHAWLRRALLQLRNGDGVRRGDQPTLTQLLEDAWDTAAAEALVTRYRRQIGELA